jgi:hypothetical protein
MAKDEMETKQLMQDEVRFTRRDLRERLGWGQTQLKIHLDRLLEMEYVMTHRTATRLVEYELIFDGRGREGQPTLPGLIDPTKCDPLPSTITSGLEDSISGQASPISGPLPPTSGARMETSGQDRANISPSSEAMQTENTNKNMEQDDMKPET